MLLVIGWLHDSALSSQNVVVRQTLVPRRHRVIESQTADHQLHGLSPSSLRQRQPSLVSKLDKKSELMRMRRATASV